MIRRRSWFSPSTMWVPDGPQVVGFGSQGFFLLRSPPTAIAFKQGEREVYGESCLERRPGHGPQWALILMIACCIHQGLASARQAVCQGEFLLKCSPSLYFFFPSTRMPILKHTGVSRPESFKWTGTHFYTLLGIYINSDVICKQG